MRTMLNYLKTYIQKEYGIDFKLVINEPNNYEKYEELVYKVGKREYTLSVGYAYSCKQERQVWSIYTDFMDYKEWYGYGGAYEDEGSKTIDEIMSKWGFKKSNQQMSLF